MIQRSYSACVKLDPIITEIQTAKSQKYYGYFQSLWPSRACA